MIRLENLSYSYTERDAALKNINLTIEDNKWISIIGHNGSGKSTLCKLLVGLLAPTSGSIFYDDVELTPKTIDSIRHKIGIVFQNPDNQFVGYNVRYDIAFGLENYKVPREKMNELITTYAEKVDMDKYLEREPQTLSGGQKQRVAIAGILALDCDIVVLDEATSMLDPEGTEEITNLICELRSKYNKTVITITHDLAMAALSDRVVVLRKGEIIADGKPEEVLEQGDLLKSSNLFMPFDLRVYDYAKNNEALKNDEKLVSALWEYHLMK